MKVSLVLRHFAEVVSDQVLFQFSSAPVSNELGELFHVFWTDKSAQEAIGAPDMLYHDFSFDSHDGEGSGRIRNSSLEAFIDSDEHLSVIF